MNWPIATRIVHLAGGGRVESPPGDKAKFVPNTITGQTVNITIPSYGALFSAIEEVGHNIVGVEFITDEFQFKGKYPIEWRFHRSKGNVWLDDLIQKWSQIAHSAYCEKNGELWDIAARISHQVELLSWRVKETSEAYYRQLTARGVEEKYSSGEKFEDGFTWQMYIAIQSFLIDACILRDYLAEYLATCIYKINGRKKKIDTMAVLKNSLKGDEQPKVLTNTIITATGKDGWLRRLSAYRNLIIHSAPLAKSESRLFAEIVYIPMTNGQNFPAIKCPIPDKPHAVKHIRDSGVLFKDFETQKEHFFKAAKGDIPSTDGMEYIHSAMEDISLFAELCSDHSPLEPRMKHFDESNIIGDVVINNR